MQESIGIVGYGVVGQALGNWFESKGYKLKIVDPPKKLNDSLGDCEFVFVCVPTPSIDTGFDSSQVYNALTSIPDNCAIVIKSTVLPGTCAQIQTMRPYNDVLFNPEFLKESTSKEDFLHPDLQIVGTVRDNFYVAGKLIRMLPDAKYSTICGAREAEMVKYTINTFLSTKVIFFNQIFDICKTLNINFEDVRNMVTQDTRIGASHTDVMADGYRGYRGKCLPKDTKALIAFGDSIGVEMSLLKEVDHINDTLGFVVNHA